MTWQLFSAAEPQVGTGQGPGDVIIVYLPASLGNPVSIMATSVFYAVSNWGQSTTAYWDTLDPLPAGAAMTPAAAAGRA